MNKNPDVSWFDFINNIISTNKVVLFIKGTSNQPYCGFSSKVVEIMKNLQVRFYECNVLESQELREEIKKFTDWPTIPQVFINSEFIGGCDILTSLYESGELNQILKINETSS